MTCLPHLSVSLGRKTVSWCSWPSARSSAFSHHRWGSEVSVPRGVGGLIPLEKCRKCSLSPRQKGAARPPPRAAPAPCRLQPVLVTRDPQPLIRSGRRPSRLRLDARRAAQLGRQLATGASCPGRLQSGCTCLHVDACAPSSCQPRGFHAACIVCGLDTRRPRLGRECSVALCPAPPRRRVLYRPVPLRAWVVGGSAQGLPGVPVVFVSGRVCKRRRRTCPALLGPFLFLLVGTTLWAAVVLPTERRERRETGASESCVPPVEGLLGQGWVGRGPGGRGGEEACGQGWLGRGPRGGWGGGPEGRGGWGGGPGAGVGSRSQRGRDLFLAENRPGLKLLSVSLSLVSPNSFPVDVTGGGGRHGGPCAARGNGARFARSLGTVSVVNNCCKLHARSAACNTRL